VDRRLPARTGEMARFILAIWPVSAAPLVHGRNTIIAYNSFLTGGCKFSDYLALKSAPRALRPVNAGSPQHGRGSILLRDGNMGKIIWFTENDYGKSPLNRK
jgi:hypothetical protein